MYIREKAYFSANAEVQVAWQSRSCLGVNKGGALTACRKDGCALLDQCERYRVTATGCAVAQSVDLWALLESAEDLVVVAERISSCMCAQVPKH